MAADHGNHVIHDVSDFSGKALQQALVSWMPARFTHWQSATSMPETVTIERGEYGGMLILTTPNGGRVQGTALALADILVRRWD